MSQYKRIPTKEALRQELVVCPYGHRWSRKTLIRGSQIVHRPTQVSSPYR
jgi:hypothetical protein